MAFFEKKPSAPAAQAGRIVGTPGIQSDRPMPPEMAAMLLTRKDSEQIIGSEDIRKASEILRKYKEGKVNLENRIVDDELWWELRHWESIRNGKSRTGAPHGPDGIPVKGGSRAPAAQPEPSSAWLFIPL